MENLYERLVDACIEMNAGEVISFDADVFAQLKRRKLIRKAREEDSVDEGVEYVITGVGQRMADRVLKARDLSI